MNRELTRGERWATVIIFFVIFGLFGLEIAVDYSPKKLSALFIALSWFPLLLLHEAAHAVVARLFSVHVSAVVIGFGRTLWSGKIGGAAVEVRSLPIEGFTQTIGERGRLASALIYFAGPGIELLVAGALLLIVGPTEMFSSTTSIGVIAAQGVALAAVAGAVLNLIPMEVRKDPTRSDTVANDGLGIWRSLFRAK